MPFDSSHRMLGPQAEALSVRRSLYNRQEGMMNVIREI